MPATDDRTPPEGWEYLNVEPSANWRKGQRMRPRKDAHHVLTEGVPSMLRSVARRPDIDITDLGYLHALHQLVEEAEAAMVANLRARGWSWADIGRELGMAKQSAHERFSR